MDPLSLTLAAITVATAVKDAVGLAHKIHDSFAKVSTNLLKAQTAANDIKNTLDDLTLFCSRHHDTLQDASDLRISLQELTAKMKAFEVEIVPLIPQTVNNKKSRLMLGWNAWKNSNKIEERIIELRSNVEKAIANFMMGALLRMETKLERMHQSTDQGLRVIHREMTSLNTTLSAPSSTSWSAMSRPFHATTDIAEELESSTYAAVQIAGLSALLQKLPLDYVAKTNPGPFSLPPVAVRLYSPLLFIGMRRLTRRINSWVSQVRCILDMTPTTDSIFKASVILNQLAAGLTLLRMHHEAALISELSVKLCRMLSIVNRVVSAPHLVHRLRNLSVHTSVAGERRSSLEAIEEAWTISTDIQKVDQSLANCVLHCRILSQYAAVVQNSPPKHVRSIELSEESVNLMEETFGLGGTGYLRFARVDNAGDSAKQTAIVHESDSVRAELALGTYAHMLRQLSNSLVTGGRAEESLHAKQRALSVFYVMKANHDDGTGLDLDIAETLYEMISQDVKSLLSRETLLSYAEECIRVYRRHAEQIPSDVSRRLRHALFEKASVLDSMGRHEYTDETWIEIAMISQQLCRDDTAYAYALTKLRTLYSYSLRSNRYETGVSSLIILSAPSPNASTTGVEAERFYDLCLDLQRGERYSEAVITARQAVDQFRLLASEDPRTWMRHVGKGMIELAHSYWSVGNRDAAYDVGHQCLQLFQTYSKSVPSILGNYCYALQINLKIAHIIEDATKATTRYLDVIRHTRELDVQHPGNWDVGNIALRAKVCYGSALVRLNRTKDARIFFHALLDEWRSHPPCTAPCNFGEWKVSALHRYGQVLDSEGLTERGLEMIQHAQDCANLLLLDIEIYNNFSIASIVKVDLLVNLGDYDNAMSLAEEILTLVRTTWKSEIETVDHVLSLNAVALVANRLRMYHRMVEVAEEALRLCQSDEYLTDFQRPLRNGSVQLSSSMHRALQFLSLGHAACGRIHQAFEYAKQAVENAIRLKSVWLPEFYSHQSYMESRVHLASILLMAGQVDVALPIYEERRDYMVNLVESSSGHYRDLIPTLRILGVIYCSQGRHDEGSAASQELRLILDRLFCIFYTLYKQVITRLQYETTATVLQVVNTMREELQCDHQAGVTCIEGSGTSPAGRTSPNY